MDWRKLIGVLAVIALIIGAGIVLFWLTGRNVYAVDVPITASPTDCGTRRALPSSAITAKPGRRKPKLPPWSIGGAWTRS